MGLYELRLFRLMEEDRDVRLYEVYRVGTIIASRGIFNCKEYLYKGKIPIVDRKKDYTCEIGEHVGSYNLHLNSKIAKTGYVVLKEDFCKKNKIKMKDVIKFKPEDYASMASKMIRYDQAPVKRLFKTKNGVVYGKSIERG